jgi:prepilin-type N-terminal cleavage/methylation domain-containing protein
MDKRRGFTVVELIIVLMVGAILTTIAMRSMSAFQTRTSVTQARQVFLSMHARARAQAIEFGRDVELRIDATSDSIWLSMDGTTLAGAGLSRELGVDIQGSSTHTVCMNSRGYAEPSCNSFTSPLTLVFAQGPNTSSVQILPLGQVIY